MADTYENFNQLSAAEKEGKDFEIFTQNAGSRIAIVAPHGGGIEPGTSEIARSISNERYNCYCFEGIKNKKNKEFLHITSTNFDEPECVRVCQNSDVVVTIHGADDEDDIVYVGGLHEELKRSMIVKLMETGFKSKEDTTGHSGKDPGNLCNRGGMKSGVQLEISSGLRGKMFKGLNRKGRKTTTQTYDRLIDSIQSVLKGYEKR